jgi:serine/threonine protein phosphatase 1
MANRVFAIGDIHGCSMALKALIEAIEPQHDDTIVFLGDVIDWGPDSQGCVRQLIDLSGLCQFVLVRGNHEEMLFAALESRSKLRYWLNFGGEETLKSYPYRGGDEFIDREHVRFLRTRARDYHETEEFIFVHASYDPNKPMREQSNTTLQWEHVHPEQMRPHFSGKTVIAGHTPQTSGEPLDLDFLKLIDTDCSREGWLTALDVQKGTIIQANQRGQIRHGLLDLRVRRPSSINELEPSPERGSTWTSATKLESKRPAKPTDKETKSSQEIVTEPDPT